MSRWYEIAMLLCDMDEIVTVYMRYEITYVIMSYGWASKSSVRESIGTYAIQMRQYVGRILPVQWRHDGCDSVSNHQPHDCLLNGLFGRKSKKTWKLCVTGLCAGNSPGTGEFPAQMASNAENVSIWWRHHEMPFVVMSYGWDDKSSVWDNLDIISYGRISMRYETAQYCCWKICGGPSSPP